MAGEPQSEDLLMRISKAVFALRLAVLLTPCVGAFAQTVPAGGRPGAAAASQPVQATAATAKLRGTVADPTGGLMPSVDIAILRGLTLVKAMKTDATGNFSFDLAAGDYQMAVTAPDFKTHTQTVRVTPNMRALAITLSLAGIASVVEVRGENEKEVTIDAASSLDATTITADQLKDLPENEEDLLAYLQLLAGGAGNAQLIIDGFEGGRLPTRDQIASIVIEPNSFNANGTGPKITIVTRLPGAQRWGGNLSFQYRDAALNARTPGSANKTPMHRTVISTNTNGPVIRGKWTTTVNLSKEQYENGQQALRAVTPSGPVNSSFLSPSTYDNLNLNNQLYFSQTNQLQVSFGYNRQKDLNQGIGGFTLPERASNAKSNGWNLSFNHNLTISPRMTNRLGFRVNHSSNETIPATNAVAINVLDAFNGGGAQNLSNRRNTNMQLTNMLQMTPTPKLNFQIALNANYQSNYNYSESNYLGTFTFSSLEDYLAGNPLTFRQTSGNPLAETRHADANASIQGTYRISPTSSGSLGVQYTLQTHLRDYNNFSPTASYTVQLKKKTTINVGARMSHPNVGMNVGIYEQLLRGDGTTRQFNTVISDPCYPDPFACGAAGTTTGAGNSISVRGPNFESPYALNSQVSVIRQFPKNFRIQTSFTVTRQVHALRTRNINAPFPGTPLDPSLTRAEIDRLRPFFPLVGQITQYESVGNSMQKGLNFQVNLPSTKKYFKTQLSGSFRYGLTWAADDSGATNLYDVRADWARNDQRHQFQSSFQIRPPKVGSFNFNLSANSGRAYSITTGKDENYDQAFNDRPLGVKRNSLRAPGGYTLGLTYNSPQFSVRKKSKPATQATPAPGGAAPTAGLSQIDQLINSAMAAGINPAQIQSLIASLSSQPGFTEGASGPVAQPSFTHPQMSFSVTANNVLNHTRVTSVSGVITSPLFGQPTSWAQGRNVYFSLSSRF
jgi:hypothetical protein